MQRGVGGYTADVILDSKDNLYIFWINDQVKSGNFEVFGEKQFSPTLFSVIEKELNTTWGHVARFTFKNGNLRADNMH